MAFILLYLGFFLYKLLLKKTGMRKLSAAIGSYIGCLLYTSSALDVSVQRQVVREMLK